MTSKNDISDLIIYIKQGDQDAFRTFFNLFQEDIYRFLYRYLLDKDSAEDLCQDTFINFWIHRQKIDSSKYPKAYLYKIARNLALNYTTRKVPSVSYENNPNVYSYAVNDPVAEYENNYLAEQCKDAVELLPERCRMTFILSRYEGLSYEEIAETMEVSQQTVKNQMSKAIAILRKKFQTAK